jgi:hypothetical protein
VHKCHLHSFLMSHKNLKFIRCSTKPITHICNRTQKLTRLISATTSIQLAVVRWNRNWCKRKHAQTYLYYDQVARLPLSREIKSFWGVHSRATYISEIKAGGRKRTGAGITQRYSAGLRADDRDLSPGRVWEFFSSPPRPDRLWGPYPMDTRDKS